MGKGIVKKIEMKNKKQNLEYINKNRTEVFHLCFYKYYLLIFKMIFSCTSFIISLISFLEKPSEIII